MKRISNVTRKIKMKKLVVSLILVATSALFSSCAPSALGDINNPFKPEYYSDTIKIPGSKTSYVLITSNPSAYGVEKADQPSFSSYTPNDSARKTLSELKVIESKVPEGWTVKLVDPQVVIRNTSKDENYIYYERSLELTFEVTPPADQTTGSVDALLVLQFKDRESKSLELTFEIGQ